MCIIDAESFEYEDRLKDVKKIELGDVIDVIEEAHTAKTPHELRQMMVYGVGALIRSESCAWTEFTADVYKKKAATLSTADMNDMSIATPDAISDFTQYVWQHPVVEHIVRTKEERAISVSEIQDRTEFQALKLYQVFYKPLSVEDQLSSGYVENGFTKGISVNRASWGFTDHERHTLTRITKSVFPFYRALCRIESGNSPPKNLIETNINNLSLHSKTLGLTLREAELLTNVAYGLSNKQIAAACSISEGTVRKHLENAFRKLGATNRVRAIIRAADIIRHAGS